MDTLNKPKIEVSQINLDDSRMAHMICHSSVETELSLIVQDELGRPFVERKAHLKAGENNIVFSAQDLKMKRYNAWIDVLGKTFIRPFKIECCTEVGLFGKIKYWLLFLRTNV